MTAWHLPYLLGILRNGARPLQVMMDGINCKDERGWNYFSVLSPYSREYFSYLSGTEHKLVGLPGTECKLMMSSMQLKWSRLDQVIRATSPH